MSIFDTSGGSRSRPTGPARSFSTRPLQSGRSEDHVYWLMIGFDPGTGGGGSAPSSQPPPRPDFGPDPGVVTPAPTPPPSGERPCTQWVIWETWYTMYDERVCPECGPLHGQQFQQGSGPQPPLHNGCRCIRREIRRECVSRGTGRRGGGANY
jgi:hypothetical protein